MTTEHKVLLTSHHSWSSLRGMISELDLFVVSDEEIWRVSLMKGLRRPNASQYIVTVKLFQPSISFVLSIPLVFLRVKAGYLNCNGKS